MRYIYRVEDTQSGSDKDLQDCLQRYGEAGFKVINIFQMSDKDTGLYYRAIFEKELSN